jgi:carboxypeptidase C (cathepsin A)
VQVRKHTRPTHLPARPPLTLDNPSWASGNFSRPSTDLEAPACVGYSWADDISGCTHDDSTQAADNYNALKVFFTAFPEFQANDFFITGESYAGIYVPTLAKAVYLGNQAGGTPKINLKGIMVGNGCLGSEIGVCAFDSANEINTNMPYFAGHGLIAPTTYQRVLKNCKDPSNPSAACETDIAQAHDEVGGVNIYDIYGPCIDGPSSSGVRLDAQTGRLVHVRAPVPVREGSGGPIACIDETIAVYIGSPAVAAALHVIPTLHWAVCGSNSSFNYQRTEKDERIDVYPVLIEQAKINVLIFNGEADACVPWVDNEAWTRSMNYSVATPWTAWASEGQVAGYFTGYNASSRGGGKNFAFATVKGSGHMVPEYTPAAAWTLFSSFVNGLTVGGEKWFGRE